MIIGSPGRWRYVEMLPDVASTGLSLASIPQRAQSAACAGVETLAHPLFLTVTRAFLVQHSNLFPYSYFHHITHTSNYKTLV